MSQSSSKPTTTNTENTSAQETNLSAANTQGVTLVGNKGLNINTTNVTSDAGAVQAGTTLGAKAIAANTGLATTVSKEASDFGSHVLDVLSKSQTESASLVSNYLAQGGALLNQEQSGYLALAEENQASENQQFGNILTTFANIATANDTSQASQQQTTDTNIIKYIVIGAVAIAAIYLAMRK